MFGAVIAAFVPVILAIFAIIVALAITALIGTQFELSFFVENMIVMMGLAVGIDYSLFILSRYREELAKGHGKIDAISIAGGTAGRAVLFSGMTVVIALLGLLIIPHTIFRSLAAGAIFVVAVSRARLDDAAAGGAELARRQGEQVAHALRSDGPAGARRAGHGRLLGPRGARRHGQADHRLCCSRPGSWSRFRFPSSR